MIFGKKKDEQIEDFAHSVLNSTDTDVFVVRGNGCQVLFANKAARQRQQESTYSCKEGFAKTFPLLCDECPLGYSENKEFPRTFDVKDKDGHIFSATCNNINWIDEKPATIFFLRDVNEERGTGNKLYTLAYIDQLTKVPNRQRFKEDFEAVSDDIANGRACGMVSIFDLDNFKNINDTYGHNTGDIMLRRLTEHLENEPAFKGHLYRLGGDEFVFFFVEKSGRFASTADARSYYENLLQAAFLSYTMPNIEAFCTISMGVAFFPSHGTTSSELLRKADIALYKAKAAGRNRLVFFEDQYDTAKKFKDLYINIQPILTEHGRTYAYELVDRGNEDSAEEDALNLAEFDRTIDALGLGDIDNDAKYLISYTNQLLNPSALNNLPKDKFIIQIPLANGISEKQLAKYKELRTHGYSLALLGLTPQNASPSLFALGDYCKFDDSVNGLEQKKLVAANPGKRFIATHVDGPDSFAESKNRGFRLFQGYFFNQPVVVKKTKDIDPLKVNYMRLLKLTSTDDYVDFREISAVIASDVALSYKLLRLLNSAAVGLRNTVSSIDMAVAYLGEDHLKKWIALLSIRGIASDKPLELVRMSLIRAQFGELLSPKMVPTRDENHVFLTGMFSLLHIALEKTKEELFEEIPVADDIRLSIMTDHGPYSDLLAFYSDYEYANWDEISRFAKENHLSDRVINEAYIAAVKWYNNLADA